MDPGHLIPHVGGAILLDEVHDIGAIDSLVATLVVRPGTAFSDSDDSLPGWVGVEILAQTVAAFATLRHGHRGEPPKVGLLLGVREYHCSLDRFPPGIALEAQIVESMSDGRALAVFDGTLRSARTVVARGILSTYRVADPRKFLMEQGP